MKIMFYIDMMKRGGAQRVMSILVNYFHKEGHEVILVNDAAFDNGVDAFFVEKDLKRVYLREDFNGNAILKNLERILRLHNCIKAEKPDVVLSFLGNCNKRMLIASVGLKTKKIVSVRNDPIREYGRRFWQKAMARQLFQKADGIVFQTKDAQKYFPASVRKKSIAILNPIDEAFFNAKRMGETGGIVTFGRLDQQKNHKLLIDAFTEIQTKYPYEKLYIYGEGSLRQELEEYVASKAMSQSIFLPGNVSNVADILSNAKIFVLSSDYEGLPNALMEALAVGVPCISTDCPCGGPKELIKNGENGILCACGDVEELSNAMESLIGDEKLREEIGAVAKNNAQRFRQDKALKEWEGYIIHTK